jgi:hypothetical protein
MFIIKFMDTDIATINIDTGEVNIIKVICSQKI